MLHLFSGLKTMFHREMRFFSNRKSFMVCETSNAFSDEQACSLDLFKVGWNILLEPVLFFTDLEGVLKRMYAPELIRVYFIAASIITSVVSILVMLGVVSMAAGPFGAPIALVLFIVS